MDNRWVSASPTSGENAFDAHKIFKHFLYDVNDVGAIWSIKKFLSMEPMYAFARFVRRSMHIAKGF